MKKPKKIINDPKAVVQEMLDGLVFAYDGKVERLGELDALLKKDIPENKVALVVGGGKRARAHLPWACWPKHG